MHEKVKILFLGDVVGRGGRTCVKTKLPELKASYQPTVTIINGENSSGGLGIEPRESEELLAAGADVITTGNHIWNKREIGPYLDKRKDILIRPVNYPPGAPGVGHCSFSIGESHRLIVVNAIGRVFSNEPLDCPFRALDDLLNGPLLGEPLIFVDFHAEATSEKIAFARFLDGRVSAVVGTHTHVQTADEQILPKGTAYISDVGMCGSRDGIIGFKAPPVIQRFVTGLPARFEVAKGQLMLNGVAITIDRDTGRAESIERINVAGS